MTEVMPPNVTDWKRYAGPWLTSGFVGKRPSETFTSRLQTVHKAITRPLQTSYKPIQTDYKPIQTYTNQPPL